jgi:hypothetical protein
MGNDDSTKFDPDAYPALADATAVGQFFGDAFARDPDQWTRLATSWLRRKGAPQLAAVAGEVVAAAIQRLVTAAAEGRVIRAYPGILAKQIEYSAWDRARRDRIDAMRLVSLDQPTSAQRRRARPVSLIETLANPLVDEDEEVDEELRRLALACHRVGAALRADLRAGRLRLTVGELTALAEQDEKSEAVRAARRRGRRKVEAALDTILGPEAAQNLRRAEDPDHTRSQPLYALLRWASFFEPEVRELVAGGSRRRRGVT